MAVSDCRRSLLSQRMLTLMLRPILTPKTVIPLLIVIGVIFGPLGGLLLYASSQVQEIAIDYSQCYKQPPGVKQSPPSYRYSSSLKGGQAEFESHTPTYVPTNATIHPHPGSDVSYDTTNCTLGFYLPADIAPPIYVYYRLTNFYQNHRRYTKSYNQQQLNGDHVSYGDLSACDPLRSPSNEDKRIYYPCGLIANSYFNDTFGPLVLQNPPNATNPNEPRVYNFSTQGIAWSSDKDLYNETSGYRNDEILPPPNWQKRWPNGYTESEPQPDLKADESFQNWMRTAGLPTFSKLVMRNEDETLLRGQYNITIVDSKSQVRIFTPGKLTWP